MSETDNKETMKSSNNNNAGKDASSLDFKKAFEPLTEKTEEEKKLDNVKAAVAEKAEEVRKGIEEMESVVVEKAGVAKTAIMEKAGECRRSIGEVIEKQSHHDEETEKSVDPNKAKPSVDRGESPAKENQVETAREWVVHKVEDFIDYIGVSPKNTEGTTKKRVSKDLVEILPGGEDRAKVHEESAPYQAKVEQARQAATDRNE